MERRRRRRKATKKKIGGEEDEEETRKTTTPIKGKTADRAKTKQKFKLRVICVVIPFVSNRPQYWHINGT